MARMNSGIPASGESSEFDVITAVVLGGTSLTGGTGNVIGTVIGAMIVGMINNMLNLWGINYNWQSIIKGNFLSCWSSSLITRSRNKTGSNNILLEITRLNVVV